MQEYGSGRQRLGINESSSSSPPPPSDNSTPSDPNNPTLGEYLQFGKLIGERVQDVQRQLDINGAEVRVDEASEKILDEWQSEQMAAYSMFEALVDEGLRGSDSEDNATLIRNKNRLSTGPASLAKFVEKAYGNAPKPMSAGDRKLARNKRRLGGGDKEVAGSEEGTFELVALSSNDENDEKAPSLIGKPMRAAGADGDSQVRKIKKIKCTFAFDLYLSVFRHAFFLLCCPFRRLRLVCSLALFLHSKVSIFFFFPSTKHLPTTKPLLW